MNHPLRLGMMLLCVLSASAAAAWIAGGSWGHGTPDHYPVTVRLWLEDSFVGGIQPAVGVPEASVLELLAAGNDLIFVDADAPRCAIWSVAWVTPAQGTPPDARVYNATISCSEDTQNTTSYTVRDILERVGP